MIDTDKYEGHREGPWEYNTDDDGWTLAAICERDNPDRDEFIVLMRKPNGDPNLTLNPDLKLLADAPLLLEEVKKLREENHNRWVVIGELRRQVEELKADLKDWMDGEEA